MLTATEVMYLIALGLLILGEAIALARTTDRDLPITDYLRAIRNAGPLGFLVMIVVWLWLGWHFIIDFDGSLPF